MKNFKASYLFWAFLSILAGVISLPFLVKDMLNEKWKK